MRPLTASRMGTTRRWKRTRARRISNQWRCWAGSRALGEDAFADLVVVVVERLHGVEVAVDDDVEQAVEQEADAVGGEVGRAVPALEHGVDREPVVLADRDEPALVDERVDLGLVEAPCLGVDAHGMAREEQVGRVVVELGSLVGAEGVLDGELVQAELAGELVELLLGGSAEVDPDRGCRALRGTRTRRRPGSPPPRGRPFGTPWSAPHP